MFKSIINFFKGFTSAKEVQVQVAPTIDKDKVAHVTKVMEAPYKVEAPTQRAKAPAKKAPVKKRAPRKPKTVV